MFDISLSSFTIVRNKFFDQKEDHSQIQEIALSLFLLQNPQMQIETFWILFRTHRHQNFK